MKSFEQYLAANYTTTELQDIARHGCQGGVTGMTYYKETSALYDEYAEDLHDIIDTFLTEQGYLPEFITQHIGSKTQFDNAVVWFCAEITAMNLTYEIEG